MTTPNPEVKTAWAQFEADMKTLRDELRRHYEPAPAGNPDLQSALNKLGQAALAPISPQAIIAQEVSAEPWIEIPEEVREVYKIWRPSPLYRAERLEKALDTPAHIYFKYEGVSPAGSHKPNTAVPQAYYNAKEGVK